MRARTPGFKCVFWGGGLNLRVWHNVAAVFLSTLAVPLPNHGGVKVGRLPGQVLHSRHKVCQSFANPGLTPPPAEYFLGWSPPEMFRICRTGLVRAHSEVRRISLSLWQTKLRNRCAVISFVTGALQHLCPKKTKALGSRNLEPKKKRDGGVLVEV